MGVTGRSIVEALIAGEGFTGQIELEGAGRSPQERETGKGIAQRLFQRFPPFHARIAFTSTISS